MQVLKLQDVHRTVEDRVFKESALVSLGAALGFAGCAVGMYLWYRFGTLPRIVIFFSGGTLSLISLVCFSCFAKTLASTNWLVAINPSRMLIKFRSYLNSHLPGEDPQVISLAFSEIKSARITKHTVKYRGAQRSGTTTEFHTYLDLIVDDDKLDGLRERLTYERSAKARKKFSILEFSTKAIHYPVSVPEAQTIRIQWRCPGAHVVPGIKQVVDLLARQHVTIEPAQRHVRDYTKSASRDDKGAEAKILELVEKGKIIAATRLAKNIYNYDTTQAKEFVEGLLQ